MRQLSNKDLKQYRQELLQTQDNLCLLCSKTIPQDKAVLDHNHKSGQVRGVLHRHCNWILGKVERASARSGIPNFLDLAQMYLKRTNLLVLYPVKRKRKKKKI